MRNQRNQRPSIKQIGILKRPPKIGSRIEIMTKVKTSQWWTSIIPLNIFT